MFIVEVHCLYQILGSWYEVVESLGLLKWLLKGKKWMSDNYFMATFGVVCHYLYQGYIQNILFLFQPKSSNCRQQGSG